MIRFETVEGICELKALYGAFWSRASENTINQKG